MDLITGPSAEPEPEGVALERFDTTQEMERAVAEALPSADVLIMAAAPADYRPTNPGATKRPRQDGELRIDFEPTADILSATRKSRKPGCLVVGFALETGDAIARGRAKLERKGLDLIVVNDALEPGAGFEGDTNRVTILGKAGAQWEVALASKASVAESILDQVEALLV